MATRKEIRDAIMADRKLSQDKQHFLNYNRDEQAFWLKGIQICLELGDHGDTFAMCCSKHDAFAELVAELSW